MAPLTPRARWQRRTTTAYLLLRMLQAATLIVYLVGSLLLTGGQFKQGQSPMWGEVLYFPLFSVPGWLMVGVSVLGVLLVIPVLVLARVRDAGRIGGAFAATGAAAAASFMFAAVLPAESAGELGLRWTAAWTDGAVAIVLMALSLVLSVRSDRARERAGLPKWTGMDDDDQR